jgi:putative membrane-bound dehydrogenase-like protein
MRQFICILSFAFCVAIHAAQFQIGSHNFTLPDGFEIELAAGTNLVPRPIEADFDEQGRLYVTDSSGSNDKVQKQLEDKPHRVVRLEDTDGDGRFDKSITFADKMMFPEGAMWLDGSLYVSAPPSIWKLTDTNSDGVADVRVEWFKGQTLGGCANDLHGPYAGPDGWIYWCKGGFVKQTNTLWNGKEFVSRASHIWRARPDGSGLEPVMTGGMDNPVGLAFTAEGERILSGTFFQNPEGGKRDGLIHALYGGVYGKVNDVLEGHTRTGELLPMMTHLGAAAPAGLMRYESGIFGKGFRNNLFVACFNMHKIVRCVMEPSGATYKTTDSDFLVSDNTDFHPTDVFEDADGSLIVVDTGGWYKLCCPTSQLHKPDVLGGIYRIRRRGAPELGDPRGRTINWAKQTPRTLTILLDDPRPAVASDAIHRLGKLGASAVDALCQAGGFCQYSAAWPRQSEPPSVRKRRNVVWALSRIDSAEARKVVRDALMDRDDSVRWTAIHSVSVWRDTNAIRDLGTLLLSGNATTRRAAAEALGRLGQENAVATLLSAVTPVKDGTSLDRPLEHSIAYALIEIGDAAKAARGLQASDAATRRVALIALDQMSGANLKPDQITPLLASTNALLKETALWIIGRHPEWGGEMARWIQDWFKPISSVVEHRQFADILARSAGQPEVQQRIAEMAARPASQATAFSAMARSRLGEVPSLWGDAVRAGLESKWGEANQRLALSAASAFNTARKNQTDLREPLLVFARDTSHSKESRLMALAALPGNAVASDTSTFDFLRTGLSPENSIAERSAAASVLAKTRPNESQLLTLADDLKSAGPIELPKLLSAFARATNESVGLALVRALKEAKALSALRADMLKPNLTNFPVVVRQRADELLASLNTDAEKEKAQLEALLESCKSGDVRRGQAIFNSPKAACSSCHAIGYLGGNVGPDLTRIGQVRNERDLLEAIVYPNASFVRSYEPMIVATKSGEEYSGVLRKDSAEEVVLATGPNIEQRIARSDVADMRPGAVSVMPSGLAEQITKEELADLLAFLKATRW